MQRGGRSGVPGSQAAVASDRPIFVVGCPRSGTTLLQLMLSAHPRIAIPPETRFVLAGYERRAQFGDLRDRDRRLALAAWIMQQPQSADLGLPPGVLRERVAEGPPTLGSAFGIAFREYAARFGKPRWGDKRPMYLNHLPTLLRLFPDAQIVHIIRDGRDCVASLRQMPWWHSGATGATSRWVQSMNMGARARRSLPDDQYHELQYEHLVVEPRRELERLCAFLAEAFDEAMLEPQRMAGEGVPKKKVWHSRTSESVSAVSVSRWSDVLQPDEVAVIDLLGWRHLRRYGYPRAAQGGAPPPVLFLQAARHLARREVGVYRERARDRSRARRYGLPVAAQLTAQQVRLAASNGEGRWAQQRSPAGAPGRR